jgi:hypothetical protein
MEVRVKRSLLLFSILCGLSVTARAKESKQYQTGTLDRMVAVHCGVSEKDDKSLTGELLGTDSGSKKSQEVLCQEYVLTTERLIYRFRPRDEKHPEILPVGEHAQFRLDKDKLVLLVEGFNEKERAYSVVAIEPRQDTTAAVVEAGPKLK